MQCPKFIFVYMLIFKKKIRNNKVYQNEETLKYLFIKSTG